MPGFVLHCIPMQVHKTFTTLPSCALYEDYCSCIFPMSSKRSVSVDNCMGIIPWQASLLICKEYMFSLFTVSDSASLPKPLLHKNYKCWKPHNDFPKAQHGLLPHRLFYFFLSIHGPAAKLIYFICLSLNLIISNSVNYICFILGQTNSF